MVEDHTQPSLINGTPKLRHAPHEENARLPSTYNHGSSVIGTIRTFSPQVQKRNIDSGDKKGFFSLFNGSETDIAHDLTTRHVDRYDGRIQDIWQSVSGNRHFTISDNMKFIINCCMWYMSSSLTNNIGKSIMNSFRFPVTLTFVQFGLVALWCYLISAVFKTTQIRKPTQVIIKTITPLAVFLIVGHVFSSIAISKVPVSLAHTIKALAPLFTVLFYRVVFKVSYTRRVYLSLLPLIFGVILACSFTYSNNIVGLSCALGSCLVFVTQNIFSKKLLFKESKMGDRNPDKLDKLNVLFYSSTLSFLLMTPLWLYSDGTQLFKGSNIENLSPTQLIIYFILNGTMNFSQNWFAFTTLSLTSPVTYSILSLLKRIFVIVMSIIWFGQQVSSTQSLGILMTFFGLWMYQKAKHDVDRGETKIQEKSLELLPTQFGKSDSPVKHL
ncbi:TPT-domain-containing protein [Backusella circina FSU 941]|nr:TPT-domain-containing protein [Backusella circina FSU 941]